MAVEAYNLNPLFHPIEANDLVYNTQFRYDTVLPATETFNPTMELHQASPLNPIYNTSPVDYLFHQSMKPEIQSVDSSVTFNSENNPTKFDFRPSSMRKRPREEESFIINPKHCTDPLMFLGQDLSFNLQQHNFVLDLFISNHMESMSMQMEEQRKAHLRNVIQKVTQKLQAKDEVINNISKQNQILEEKIQSLCVENQIWRDMSLSSEATANTLRSNIQQVLTSVDRLRKESKIVDDAQSCCGSNDYDDQLRLEEDAQDKKRRRRMTWRTCVNCEKREVSVLLLPCRHLCLCSRCGSSVKTCPICKSSKTSVLTVNLS